jgi:molybdopterin synthase catalytic subunit
VLSAHRADAFAACQFIMDYLKTEAPFWKKEVSEQGVKWVESRDSDELARKKWES